MLKFFWNGELGGFTKTIVFTDNGYRDAILLVNESLGSTTTVSFDAIVEKLATRNIRIRCTIQR